ncbi:enoyl-CoA hydratase/isomerase [Lysinibacillus sp. NPDC092081]|uniref:enoyl-CoA hydratase/isomerase n=1 Tax=Lysinibacillus sp. NPDC092081 TaxID=3364131 RepID=UPI00380712AF
MSYETIRVRFQEPICFLQFYRPGSNNTINEKMIEECHHVLDLCEETITVIVLEGLEEFFCFGADFQEIYDKRKSEQGPEKDSSALYNLWFRLATGPNITVSHVHGKTNAGGVGFVAASDVVIANQSANFSLSELLFGLFPAIVLPFLIRRIGYQKANYMTLMTKPISAPTAQEWGLVDVHGVQSEILLRQHLLRFRHISKDAIRAYKGYMAELYEPLYRFKPLSIAANQKLFSDARNLESISRFVQSGKLPWED